VVETSKSAVPAPDQEQMATLEAALVLLESARQKLRQGLLADALDLYEQVRSKIQGRARMELRGGGSLRTVALIRILDQTPDLGAVPKKAADRPLPGVDQASRRLAWTNRLIQVLTIIVGVIAGVAALYDGKPTWGSLGDITVALLWGVGLVSVGAAVGGYVGVRDKLAE